MADNQTNESSYREEGGWLIDQNNNRAEIEYFGSREAAEKALASLKNCRDCTNCSRCSGCSGCSDCSGCSGCSDCSGCSRCSDCSGCSGCSDCSGCSRCSDCSDCSGCSRCSRCSDCSGCSRCSDCSGCSRCSDCSGCSDCSHIARLHDKRKVRVYTDNGTVTRDVGMPPVPRIENIHQRILEAVTCSPGNKLEMSSWHTCETTHCRAGWVVHLAGPAGYALEKFHNTELAAMLIYRESGHYINPARFYDGNEAAMEDIRRLAESAS